MVNGGGEILQKIALLMLAGALGTLCRYGIYIGISAFFGRNLLWGTAFVNTVGCFLFGMVWVLAEEKNLIGEAFRVVLLVGFLGAFTTFSTFIFESGVLLHNREWMKLCLNLLMQNVLGFAALYLGYVTGRLF